MEKIVKSLQRSVRAVGYNKAAEIFFYKLQGIENAGVDTDWNGCKTVGGN